MLLIFELLSNLVFICSNHIILWIFDVQDYKCWGLNNDRMNYSEFFLRHRQSALKDSWGSRCRNKWDGAQTTVRLNDGLCFFFYCWRNTEGWMFPQWGWGAAVCRRVVIMGATPKAWNEPHKEEPCRDGCLDWWNCSNWMMATHVIRLWW